VLSSQLAIGLVVDLVVEDLAQEGVLQRRYDFCEEQNTHIACQPVHHLAIVLL
jgi:hypothetical protein